MLIRGRVQYGQKYRGRSPNVNNYRNDFKRGLLGKGKIIVVRILEVDIVVIIKTSLEEVEVGLGKDNFKVNLEGIIKAPLVDQDQGQE